MDKSCSGRPNAFQKNQDHVWQVCGLEGPVRERTVRHIESKEKLCAFLSAIYTQGHLGKLGRSMSIQSGHQEVLYGMKWLCEVETRFGYETRGRIGDMEKVRESLKRDSLAVFSWRSFSHIVRTNVSL